MGALGRVIKHTLPEGMFETFVYDAAGRLASQTDFNGQTTSYTYDAITDRLETLTYQDAGW